MDVHGKSIPGLVGDTVHYLDNEAAESLIDFDDFHDRRVRVTGRVYGREHMLAVFAFDPL